MKEEFTQDSQYRKMPGPSLDSVVLKAAVAETLGKQYLEQHPYSFFSFELSSTPTEILGRPDPELSWNRHIFT